MSKRLSKAPVFFTVAQVRFNTVLNLETYLPAIQEKFRRQLFPDFRREDVQRIVFPVGTTSEPGDGLSPLIQAEAHFLFGDMSRTTEFVLQNSSLALQTTDYDTFEKFSELLLKGLTIVHGVLELAFAERVGIRYFDAVIPDPDESLSKYLAPEVLGLSEKLPKQLQSAYSRTVIRTEAGRLVSQVIIRDGRVGLPDDASALALPINDRFLKSTGRHAVMDTDSYFEERQSFDIARLESTLNSLHEEASDCFHATVTPFALEEWA